MMDNEQENEWPDERVNLTARGEQTAVLLELERALAACGDAEEPEL